MITSIVTTSVLAITLTSSAYSGSAGPLLAEFNTSKELVSGTFPPADTSHSRGC